MPMPVLVCELGVGIGVVGVGRKICAERGEFERKIMGRKRHSPGYYWLG